MLQTSRWVLHINNMFLKKDLTAQINVEEDGSLTFYAVTEKGLKPFPKEMSDKLTVDGDTISSEVELDEMPGMKILFSLSFGEKKAEGYFKVPILGKMKFKGEKIEMTDLPVIETSGEEFTEKAEEILDNKE